MPFLIRLRVFAKYHLPGFLVRFLQFFWRTFVRPAGRGLGQAKARLIKAWWLGRNAFWRGGPLPPEDLIFLVSGGRDVVWFLKSGRLARKSVLRILADHGISTERLNGILDFGCGAGRVIRHLRPFSKSGLFGTDYNPDLIAWCRENHAFARFEVNPFLGPLRYPNASFGLVYAFSVFTHLTENQQDAWIGEFGRVLRPGGYLLVSVHGEYHVRDYPEETRSRFAAGEMIVFAAEVAGTNVCTAFHPPDYMNSRFAPGFALVGSILEGALGNPRQDLYLFRKP